MNLGTKHLLVGSLFLASLAMFALTYKQKPVQQIKTKQPQVFQPEAQMLSEAILAKQSAKETPRKIIKNIDQPKTAAKNSAPYVYDSIVCSAAQTQNFVCLSDYYKNLVHSYGASIAFQDLKKRFNENPYVAAQCHPITHSIGQEASNSYNTISESYLHGDVFCWSGYYHGVMEGFALRIGKENLPSKLDSMCADIPGKATYNFDYYNCVHGLGHGIMELLDDNVFSSLSMCDNLSGFWEKESCYSGVFMENIIANDNLRGSSYVSPYLKPLEPLYPCTAVDQKYKNQCYLGQTSYALEISGYNFQKVTELCATVEQPFRDICFQSIGRDAANQAHHAGIQTSTICSLSTDQNDVRNCIIGAVKEFVSYYHSDKEAHDFCTILNESNKTMCMIVTDDYYKIF